MKNIKLLVLDVDGTMTDGKLAKIRWRNTYIDR